jgi:hypothetical protein
VRASACLTAAAIAGCHPSATVERTMPVANLQSYRTVAVRVRSSTYTSQGMAAFLEASVQSKLQQRCGFEQIVQAGGAPADVLVDLTITAAGRGGSGWIRNNGVATLDSLLVLSDGQSGDPLGTARIHGQSSGMIVNNTSPENEALDVVAKSVVDVLASSGCSGPRIARTEPPPAPTPAAPGPGPAPTRDQPAPPPSTDESHRAEAEALNDQGKDKLRGADIAGALVAFQQANALVPDPRYEYNVCLAFEAQAQWDQALAACKQARGMNPQAKLVAKIDHRIELLQQHH